MGLLKFGLCVVTWILCVSKISCDNSDATSEPECIEGRNVAPDEPCDKCTCVQGKIVCVDIDCERQLKENITRSGPTQNSMYGKLRPPENMLGGSIHPLLHIINKPPAKRGPHLSSVYTTKSNVIKMGETPPNISMILSETHVENVLDTFLSRNYDSNDKYILIVPEASEANLNRNKKEIPSADMWKNKFQVYPSQPVSVAYQNKKKITLPLQNNAWPYNVLVNENKHIYSTSLIGLDEDNDLPQIRYVRNPVFGPPGDKRLLLRPRQYMRNSELGDLQNSNMLQSLVKRKRSNPDLSSPFINPLTLAISNEIKPSMTFFTPGQPLPFNQNKFKYPIEPVIVNHRSPNSILSDVELLNNGKQKFTLTQDQMLLNIPMPSDKNNMFKPSVFQSWPLNKPKQYLAPNKVYSNAQIEKQNIPMKLPSHLVKRDFINQYLLDNTTPYKQLQVLLNPHYKNVNLDPNIIKYQSLLMSEQAKSNKSQISNSISNPVPSWPAVKPLNLYQYTLPAHSKELIPAFDSSVLSSIPQNVSNKKRSFPSFFKGVPNFIQNVFSSKTAQTASSADTSNYSNDVMSQQGGDVANDNNFGNLEDQATNSISNQNFNSNEMSSINSNSISTMENNNAHHYNYNYNSVYGNTGLLSDQAAIGVHYSGGTSGALDNSAQTNELFKENSQTHYNAPSNNLYGLPPSFFDDTNHLFPGLTDNTVSSYYSSNVAYENPASHKQPDYNSPQSQNTNGPDTYSNYKPDQSNYYPYQPHQNDNQWSPFSNGGPDTHPNTPNYPHDETMPVFNNYHPDHYNGPVNDVPSSNHHPHNNNEPSNQKPLSHANVIEIPDNYPWVTTKITSISSLPYDHIKPDTSLGPASEPYKNNNNMPSSHPEVEPVPKFDYFPQNHKNPLTQSPQSSYDAPDGYGNKPINNDYPYGPKNPADHHPHSFHNEPMHHSPDMQNLPHTNHPHPYDMPILHPYNHMPGLNSPLAPNPIFKDYAPTEPKYYNPQTDSSQPESYPHNVNVPALNHFYPPPGKTPEHNIPQPFNNVPNSYPQLTSSPSFNPHIPKKPDSVGPYGVPNSYPEPMPFFEDLMPTSPTPYGSPSQFKPIPEFTHYPHTPTRPDSSSPHKPGDVPSPYDFYPHHPNKPGSGRPQTPNEVPGAYPEFFDNMPFPDNIPHMPGIPTRPTIPKFDFYPHNPNHPESAHPHTPQEAPGSSPNDYSTPFFAPTPPFDYYPHTPKKPGSFNPYSPEDNYPHTPTKPSISSPHKPNQIPGTYPDIFEDKPFFDNIPQIPGMPVYNPQDPYNHSPNAKPIPSFDYYPQTPKKPGNGNPHTPDDNYPHVPSNPSISSPHIPNQIPGSYPDIFDDKPFLDNIPQIPGMPKYNPQNPYKHSPNAKPVPSFDYYPQTPKKPGSGNPHTPDDNYPHAPSNPSISSPHIPNQIPGSYPDIFDDKPFLDNIPQIPGMPKYNPQNPYKHSPNEKPFPSFDYYPQTPKKPGSFNPYSPEDNYPHTPTKPSISSPYIPNHIPETYPDIFEDMPFLDNIPHIPGMPVYTTPNPYKKHPKQKPMPNDPFAPKRPNSINPYEPNPFPDNYPEDNLPFLDNYPHIPKKPGSIGSPHKPNQGPNHYPDDFDNMPPFDNIPQIPGLPGYTPQNPYKKQPKQKPMPNNPFAPKRPNSINPYGPNLLPDAYPDDNLPFLDNYPHTPKKPGSIGSPHKPNQGPSNYPDDYDDMPLFDNIPKIPGMPGYTPQNPYKKQPKQKPMPNNPFAPKRPNSINPYGPNLLPDAYPDDNLPFLDNYPHTPKKPGSIGSPHKPNQGPSNYPDDYDDMPLFDNIPKIPGMPGYTPQNPYKKQPKPKPMPNNPFAPKRPNSINPYGPNLLPDAYPDDNLPFLDNYPHTPKKPGSIGSPHKPNQGPNHYPDDFDNMPPFDNIPQIPGLPGYTPQNPYKKQPKQKPMPNNPFAPKRPNSINPYGPNLLPDTYPDDNLPSFDNYPHTPKKPGSIGSPHKPNQGPSNYPDDYDDMPLFDNIPKIPGMPGYTPQNPYKKQPKQKPMPNNPFGPKRPNSINPYGPNLLPDAYPDDNLPFLDNYPHTPKKPGSIGSPHKPNQGPSNYPDDYDDMPLFENMPKIPGLPGYTPQSPHKKQPKQKPMPNNPFAPKRPNSINPYAPNLLPDIYPDDIGNMPFFDNIPQMSKTPAGPLGGSPYTTPPRFTPKPNFDNYPHTPKKPGSVSSPNRPNQVPDNYPDYFDNMPFFDGMPQTPKNSYKKQLKQKPGPTSNYPLRPKSPNRPQPFNGIPEIYPDDLGNTPFFDNNPLTPGIPFGQPRPNFNPLLPKKPFSSNPLISNQVPDIYFDDYNDIPFIPNQKPKKPSPSFNANPYTPKGSMSIRPNMNKKPNNVFSPTSLQPKVKPNSKFNPYASKNPFDFLPDINNVPFSYSNGPNKLPSSKVKPSGKFKNLPLGPAGYGSRFPDILNAGPEIYPDYVDKAFKPYSGKYKSSNNKYSGYQNTIPDYAQLYAQVSYSNSQAKFKNSAKLPRKVKPSEMPTYLPDTPKQPDAPTDEPQKYNLIPPFNNYPPKSSCASEAHSNKKPQNIMDLVFLSLSNPGVKLSDKNIKEFCTICKMMNVCPTIPLPNLNKPLCPEVNKPNDVFGNANKGENCGSFDDEKRQFPRAYYAGYSNEGSIPLGWHNPNILENFADMPYYMMPLNHNYLDVAPTLTDIQRPDVMYDQFNDVAPIISQINKRDKLYDNSLESFMFPFTYFTPYQGIINHNIPVKVELPKQKISPSNLYMPGAIQNVFLDEPTKYDMIKPDESDNNHKNEAPLLENIHDDKPIEVDSITIFSTDQPHITPGNIIEGTPQAPSKPIKVKPTVGNLNIDDNETTYIDTKVRNREPMRQKRLYQIIE